MKNLKLTSLNSDDKKRTVITVDNVKIGEDFVVIAGPCSVESEEQTIKTAQKVKEAGANMLRGGAFKPRTSPYAFQGLGLKGLKILEKAKKETGLPVVTEVTDPRDVSWVCEYADVLQIGCERGIRTFETYTRNTLDLSIVPSVREISHLPIIVDPSHGTGRLSIIEPMSLAAMAAGADGIIIEVHYNPREALSDKDQAMPPYVFAGLMKKLHELHDCMNGINKVTAQVATKTPRHKV